MKILEYMSFNPSWFTTLPGMLITGGVVLLLVALIILLTSGSGKKEEEIAETSTNSLESNLNNVENPVQVTVPETPVMDIPAQPVTAEPQLEIFEPAVAPNAQVTEPVQSVPTLNIENPTIVNETPVQPSENKVEPVVQIDTPTVEPVVNPLPNNNPQPAQPSVSIYGGVSPSVNLYNEAPSKPVIYGGADPLENTAPIPKVEPTPVAEVKVVEPIVPQSVVQPAAVMEHQNEGVIPDTSATPVTPSVSTQTDEVETLDF